VHLAVTQVGMLAEVFTWDPFIRGILITLLFVVLLPGSVLLVLSTDVGGRLGFLIMAAAMTGMLSMLALLWMPLSSTADIGRPNSWKPLQVITGNYTSQVIIKAASTLPVNNLAAGTKPILQPLSKAKHWFWPLQSCNDDSWHKIDPSLINDPESESDTVLANTAGVVFPPQLTSPFSATTDYVYIDGYRRGYNAGCLFSINKHKVYLPFFRAPDIVVLRVLPALPTLTLGGAPVAAQADTTKPYTYVIMERNLGSVRQPQAMLAISMGICFLVICYVLHTREKEKDAAEEEGSGGHGGAGGTPGPGGGSSGGAGGAGAARETVGAGV